MAGDEQPSDAREDSSRGQQSQGGPSQGRRRSLRRLGMPEGERAARHQRRALFQNRFGPGDEDGRRGKTKDGDAKTIDPNTSQVTIEPGMSTGEQKTTETEETPERKPWETIVIGDLGDNLSFIERKDRQIEQQRYILKYHEEHSPHQVPHNKIILEKLVRERAEMADNEENNMPEDQREERNRIGERLDALNWGLDTCQCEAEEVNIRAAIQGYQSGEIPYSTNFTLIYGGHIVDVCPTYQSFCRDRQERLDRYFARYGPGWLWHEPPLSEPGFGGLAMKGLGLQRVIGSGSYYIGHYFVSMTYSIDPNKVKRGNEYAGKGASRRAKKQANVDYSCRFKTLLDCGATFPNLPLVDLNQMGVDLKWYPAQGITQIQTVTTRTPRRFFEMYVSVCSDDGATLVSEGDQAVWPAEPRTLGGLYPVWINESIRENSRITDRLSGMVPFDACYISSAPTAYEFWLGEDRRDVLGSKRMPAHLRFDPDKQFDLKYPKQFQRLRDGMKTPDQVIFIHHLEGDGKRSFTDADWPGVRGKSEQAIIRKRFDKTSQRTTMKTTRSVVLEPREGPYREAPSGERAWRRDFLTEEDFKQTTYTGVGDEMPYSETVAQKRRRERRERWNS
ncbi:hypothetical protein F4677DRAFT_138290 [Hypoxylon crocopeplum]|nr:hypothetical protein F4677DRAFT_138290 [Hypoxylon crocopeplum]